MSVGLLSALRVFDKGQRYGTLHHNALSKTQEQLADLGSLPKMIENNSMKDTASTADPSSLSTYLLTVT